MLKRILKLVIAVIILFGIGFGLSKGLELYKNTFYPIKYSEYVEKYSKENELDPYLIYAIIKTESKFQKDVISNVGARGLMQLMEDTFEWIKFRKKDDRDISYDDIFNPEYNIEYGTYMMKLLCDEYEDLPTAIAAYHAGRGTVNKWLKSPEYSSDGKTLSNIPSKTTAHYVDKVISAYEGYTNLYNNKKDG